MIKLEKIDGIDIFKFSIDEDINKESVEIFGIKRIPKNEITRYHYLVSWFQGFQSVRFHF